MRSALDSERWPRTPKDFRGTAFGAGWKRQEHENVENADLSDEAPADVSNDCGLMAKSEGVQDPPASLREALRAGLSSGVCRILQRVSAQGPWELSPGFSLAWRYFYVLDLEGRRTMPGQSHIDCTQIQMTISSAPSGLVAFIGTPPGPAGAHARQLRVAIGIVQVRWWLEKISPAGT